MNNLTNIEDHKPHIALRHGNLAWVTPVSLLEDVANKKIPVTDIDDWEDFIPALINAYLEILE